MINLVISGLTMAGRKLKARNICREKQLDKMLERINKNEVMNTYRKYGTSSMAYLEICEVTKRFPGGVVAVDHISLSVEKGEIRAILGENGAGKTTLMNILYGLYQPDEGRMILDGEVVQEHTPQKALSLGIGMIHQNFMLVEAFTVLENILVGLPPPQPLLLTSARVEKRIRELSRKYNLPVDCQARISDLSVGEQQRVEIVKTLYRDAQLIILDEPTAVLTPQEVEVLFKVLKEMAAQGKTILFISHKLKEVCSISDRITVLRAGKVIGTIPTSEATHRKLADMMVGKEVILKLERPPRPSGKIVLKVSELSARKSSGIEVLKGVSFMVREGEILGVAGVSGNGQLELAEVLAGLIPATRGKIILSGKDITGSLPRGKIDAGLAYIPGDRLRWGCIPDFSVANNLVLKSFWKNPFTIHGLLQPQKIAGSAQRLIREFDIRTPSSKVEVKKLSGGNIQKMILAREMSLGPSMLLAAQPSRGLDIAATEYVWQRLLKTREEKKGVLLISEDLEEILTLSDRIMVMYEGRIRKEMPNENVDINQLGLLMAGAETG